MTVSVTPRPGAVPARVEPLSRLLGEASGLRRRLSLPVAVPSSVDAGASRSWSRAASVVAAATPAVRSSSTRVAKPAPTASSAVARTQWSVAMPDDVDRVDPVRAQPVGQRRRPSQLPSKPE